MVNDSSAQVLTARIASVFTNPLNLNEDADLQLYTINNGTVWKTSSFKSTGQLQLDKYGVGTFVATPAYALGVDAFGDVVEFTASPTTGDSISPFLLMGG
jgi:hypothetical protein